MVTRYQHISELNMSRAIQDKCIWKLEGKHLATDILPNKVLSYTSFSFVTNIS